MEVRIKNNLEEIAAFSEKFESFGLEKGVPAKEIFRVILAMDELLTNVISYSYPEGGEHEIFVQFDLESQNTLKLILVDDGVEFNPLERKGVDISLDIEEREIGGLGIHMVKTIMDVIKYKRENNKNILIMKKNIDD